MQLKNRYTNPSSVLPQNYRTLSDEELAPIYDKFEAITADNLKIYREVSEEWTNATKLASDCFGENSNVHKYLKNHRIPSIPFQDLWRVKNSVADWRRAEAQRLQDQKQAERELQRAEEQERLTNEAIVYLQNKSFKLGTDFSISNAFEMANEIAHDDLVKTTVEAIKNGGDYVELEYYICEGDGCKGWDGDSNRCDCGNRRLNWSYEGNFKEPWIRPEAH
jgi:hypothetical protein